MINFTWWVNRKDAQGRNIFQGGFLGLDNIGVFDRSAPLPTGGLHQPGRRHELDGDVFAEPHAHRARTRAAQQSLRRHRDEIFRALPRHRRGYQLATTRTMGLWDEQDEFYYDRIAHARAAARFRSRCDRWSGLIPLFAVETLEPELLKELPEFAGRLKWFLNYRPDLAKLVSHWEECGVGRAPPALAVARPSHEMSAAPNAQMKPNS